MPTVPSTKFSRYRSVRFAASKEPVSNSDASPFVSQHVDEDKTRRSGSRYRQPRSANPPTHPSSEPLPWSERQQGLLPTPVDRAQGEDSRIPFRTRDPPEATNSTQRPPSEEIVPRSIRLDDVDNGESDRRRRRRLERRDDKDRQRERSKNESIEQTPQQSTERENTSPQRNDTRWHGRELRNQQTEEQPDQSSKAKEKHGLFSRRRPDKNAENVRGATQGLTKFRGITKDMISPPLGIQPGGGGIVPGTDAPLSAVNAGERKVKVKWNGSSIMLPITPSSRTVDLIQSAANKLSEDIDPKITVMLESFKQLGLERPLRRYEHIRDVLNSWDHDTQNTLLIVPSTNGGIDEELDAEKVPLQPPPGESAYMYYSQKPGSWDKRWISLKADGQVTIAKNDHGEAKNICHLSDFDIYIPTLRQMEKKLKPPRKSCFAIKSQQKSSIFLSTANFVHFFSTKDRDLAARWYKAVQEWRSWHLLYIMGKGEQIPKAEKDLKSNTLPNQVNHQNLPSTESRQLQPKTTKPLPAVDQSPQRDVVNPQPSNLRTSPAKPALDSNGLRARSKSHRTNAGPPISFPKYLIKDPETPALPNPQPHGPPPYPPQTTLPLVGPNQDPFASTGLLGRSYTQRRNPPSQQPTTLPPTLTSTLTNHPPPISRFTPKDPTPLTRSPSKRTKPVPLVDLTPQYQPPPQHVRKGRGVQPEKLPPGGLIDIATSPEVAIQVPEARAWRRPGTSSGEGQGIGGGLQGGLGRRPGTSGGER